MLFKDGHSLCFGRMRRDDRPHTCGGKKTAKLCRLNALPGCLGHQIGESALGRRLASHALGLAAQPHRSVLLDDREKLEPDAVSLKNAGELLRCKIFRL